MLIKKEIKMELEKKEIYSLLWTLTNSNTDYVEENPVYRKLQNQYLTYKDGKEEILGMLEGAMERGTIGKRNQRTIEKWRTY